MKELSLNILDISENSVKAGASLVKILLSETEDKLEIRIEDDGVGMTAEVVRLVEDPFYTTRTTRKVGMGVPLFRFAAEQTEGSFTITSRHIGEYPKEHGTEVVAVFNKDHIDYTPLGDVILTLVTLIQGHPNTDFLFVHEKECGEVRLDTRELREVLEGVPLDTFEVVVWIKENLAEQYDCIKNK